MAKSRTKSYPYTRKIKTTIRSLINDLSKPKAEWENQPGFVGVWISNGTISGI